MKNLIILILLIIIAYLLYSSGIFDRAVQSVRLTSNGTPNPNETPRISVTVYSPYGTGIKTPDPSSTPVPENGPPLTLLRRKTTSNISSSKRLWTAQHSPTP